MRTNDPSPTLSPDPRYLGPPGFEWYDWAKVRFPDGDTKALVRAVASVCPDVTFGQFNPACVAFLYYRGSTIYPPMERDEAFLCESVFLRALAALGIVRHLYYCGETDDWSLTLKADDSPNHGQLLPLLVAALIKIGAALSTVEER